MRTSHYRLSCAVYDVAHTGGGQQPESRYCRAIDKGAPKDVTKDIIILFIYAVDLHEDFIDEKAIAVATMISLQPLSVYSAKFDTPQANRFTADSDAPLGEQDPRYLGG